MAEELNRLMADGFHVFHDVPFDNFNMDHVLVGPTGLFLVETKTKSKPVLKGKKQYAVVFDGQKLNFPNGWDTDALGQMRRNKNMLSRWLSSATADRHTIEGIIAIPGWYVERTVRSDIHVVNPRKFEA